MDKQKIPPSLCNKKLRNKGGILLSESVPFCHGSFSVQRFQPRCHLTLITEHKPYNMEYPEILIDS